MADVKLVSFGELLLDFQECVDGDVEVVDANGDRVVLTVEEFILAAEWLKTQKKEKANG